MQIAFTSTVEAGDVLVLPFQKDAVDTGRIEGEGAAALAKAAVDAARFKGEAGSIVELFATVGGTARRILLLGVGEGKEADWRKAGGALTAKLLTNATSASVDLTGLSTKPAAEAVASFAGAAVQRGWRHDVYRTKLPETSADADQDRDRRCRGRCGIRLCARPCGEWRAGADPHARLGAA